MHAVLYPVRCLFLVRSTVHLIHYIASPLACYAFRFALACYALNRLTWAVAYRSIYAMRVYFSIFVLCMDVVKPLPCWYKEIHNMRCLLFHERTENSFYFWFFQKTHFGKNSPGFPLITELLEFCCRFQCSSDSCFLYRSLRCFFHFPGRKLCLGLRKYVFSSKYVIISGCDLLGSVRETQGTQARIYYPNHVFRCYLWFPKNKNYQISIWSSPFVRIHVFLKKTLHFHWILNFFNFIADSDARSPVSCSHLVSSRVDCTLHTSQGRTLHITVISYCICMAFVEVSLGMRYSSVFHEMYVMRSFYALHRLYGRQEPDALARL